MDEAPHQGEKERLADARQVVKQQAFYMKRALDQRNLRDGLKHASSMLGELRTSALGPKSYYDLYISATDELRHLEAYVAGEQRQGRRMLELYELVQHAGNILPRLYLLLTVGSVYITSREAPAKDILVDLVEMCRGVQHPMRGLFLRNYLAQATKSKLPDTGSDYEGGGGTVADAISFVLSNFSEMNKLWVRMQHQGPVREREAREKERLELRILVGTNLMQLSKLEGVDLATYSEAVLPPILEQVVNCKDAIAQRYLMECVAQVFPLEFHIATLPVFLQHTKWLSAGADVKALLIAMMRRLADAEGSGEEGKDGADGEAGGSDGAASDRGAGEGSFALLAAHLKTLHPADAASAGVTDVEDTLELYQALLAFVLSSRSKSFEQIDSTLTSCVALLDAAAAHGVAASTPRAVKVLLEIVTQPISHLSPILQLLQLSSWPPLLAHLPYARQKEVASQLVGQVLAQKATIAAYDDAGKLLRFVQPLTVDPPDESVDADDARPAPIDEETAAELGLLSRLVHSFAAPTTDEQCRMLNTTHKQAVAGAFRRSPFTLVPVVFACLSLCRRIHVRVAQGEAVEVGVHKLLGFVASIVASLKSIAPALAMRLNLASGLVADSCMEADDGYDFFVQAFVTYEEDISHDSRAQLPALTLASATLHHTHHFTAEPYDTLATKATQYSGKLLKKQDQCRAVAKASLLFTTSSAHLCDASPPGGDTVDQDGEADAAAPAEPPAAGREPGKVLKCLQRALTLADACKASQMHLPLFVETLDSYLFHYAARSPVVSANYITSLLQLIEQQLSEDNADDAPPNKDAARARAHFGNTKAYIKQRCSTDERFREIE